MKLFWLPNTRPVLFFEILHLAQITEDIFESSERETMKKLNGTIQFAVSNQVSLQVPKLDKQALCVTGYSASSFAKKKQIFLLNLVTYAS